MVRPAHQTFLPQMGNVSDDLIAYHEARAIGGVGLTIIETMGIHPSSPGTIWGFHPDLPNSYPRMMDRLKRHGMTVFQQLWHAGHNTPTLDGGPPWSASDQPSIDISPMFPSGVPLAMTKAMIDEGYHPMTMYFPLVVHGAMLIEPTESESKSSLDLFIATLRDLAMAAKTGNDKERFTGAPHHAPRRRLDETRAARNPVLKWTPPEPVVA